MIVFFRLDRLAYQLQQNTVPEFHKFLYLFLPAVFAFTSRSGGGVGLVNFLQGSAVPTLETADFLYDFAITFIGLIVLWKLNRRGDGKNFLERYICLGFPIYVIVNILGFLLGFFGPLLLFHFSGLTGSELIEPNKIVRVVGLNLNRAISLLLYAYWLNKIAQRQVRLWVSPPVQS